MSLLDMFQTLLSDQESGDVLSEMMNQMGRSYRSGELSDLKENIVKRVLTKIGIDPSSLEDLHEKGKSNDILTSLDDLSYSKSHDFLIVLTYKNDRYGYISYTGTYEDAKKHALYCLGKEHGMHGCLPNEQSYLVRRYPIYTLETDYVRIEVVPHASWVSIE